MREERRLAAAPASAAGAEGRALEVSREMGWAGLVGAAAAAAGWRAGWAEKKVEEEAEEEEVPVAPLTGTLSLQAGGMRLRMNTHTAYEAAAWRTMMEPGT